MKPRLSSGGSGIIENLIKLHAHNDKYISLIAHNQRLRSICSWC